jgi:hypothetical protein
MERRDEEGGMGKATIALKNAGRIRHIGRKVTD